MTLLEIFAGYTSFMLQNALDAKRAHELAKRDDLTGLYNDRWFNVRLTEALAEARKTSGGGADLHGPRPLQVHQRLPRPSRRQPGAARGRLHPQADRCRRRRHGCALRRRRIRDRPSRHAARGRHGALRRDPRARSRRRRSSSASGASTIRRSPARDSLRVDRHRAVSPRPATRRPTSTRRASCCAAPTPRCTARNRQARTRSSSPSGRRDRQRAGRRVLERS